ncbi:DUF6069 family protein [Halomarina oriensis]|uniref:Uncharacterized protein n=1 Tax=Halomarina oriensis TaxID=671145 RepID=A0A6B0GMQ4_9EURY|nr:hypothetical protein [Halomarina oriensis]
MATSTPTPPAGGVRTRLDSGTLVRRGLVAALLALVLTVVARFVAVALDSTLAGVEQFGWVPIVAVTLVASVGATLVYATLDRLTERPARWFLVAAALVFLFMLAPLTLGAGDLGLPTNAQLGLGALHLTAAVGIVVGLLGVGSAD